MSDGPSLSKGGVVIPGYEVERELGRGGFAVVYRASQPKLRRTVALKVLTNVDPSDEDAKRRFEAECQAIGSLSWHPHVVTVYDAGQTEEGLPFLAMENLPSGSLQAKLADHGPAPWEEVLRVTVQMCDALGAAHQAGILHRDIKPANVLTSRIGDYKLADFGIARFGDTQRTATGVITGTVAYTAPEVLRGARASSASDIYALGAMLCAVATGKTPFVKEADESVVAIMYRVNTEDPPPLDDHDIPADLALLIHTLMDKDPEKRPGSALEVAQWAQYIQEQHGIASAPLHTDPDMEPGLPEAAIAAGAAALSAGASAPSAPASPAPAPSTTTPPPQPAYGQQASYTPPPQPQQAWGAGTPAPQTAYGQQSGAYDPSTGGYGPATGYNPSPQSGTYGPQTGAYGYGQAHDEGSNGGKIVAIVAVVALVIVAVIIAVAAAASGGDSSASDRQPDGASAGTEEEASEDTDPEVSAETVAPPTEPTGGFSEETREAFVTGCTGSGATEEQCGCIVDGLEDTYTEDELAALGTAGITDLPPEIQSVVEDCL
ncbi:serine/threonine protein kinase [Iamia sp. SCSIO 61187]|uniref:serine/threonine-protein kinase n=1 Tax=Iamia sp. SCSIO 61187 TaxID=2722752 RepID=UPI001C633F26|nr:serine/threonine-protein kinase [Iamia sp. SCSIO 61187]QYG94551.1 serine/threonine protein kinase [Iamia sp. SCSIO 61187]